MVRATMRAIAAKISRALAENLSTDDHLHGRTPPALGGNVVASSLVPLARAQHQVGHAIRWRQIGHLPAGSSGARAMTPGGRGNVDQGRRARWSSPVGKF